jgi:hypothetical protein
MVRVPDVWACRRCTSAAGRDQFVAAKSGLLSVLRGLLLAKPALRSLKTLRMNLLFRLGTSKCPSSRSPRVTKITSMGRNTDFSYQLGFTAWVRHHVRRGLLDRPGLVLRAAMLGP